jgi:hypothetical protein
MSIHTIKISIFKIIRIEVQYKSKNMFLNLKKKTFKRKHLKKPLKRLLYKL